MMKKLEKLKRHWRILLCSVLCLLLIAAITVSQLLSDIEGDMKAGQVRAAAAVRQVAAQFQQAVEDGFRQLRVGSVAIGGGEEAIDAMLSSLVSNGSFEKAALIDGESMRMDDGSVLEKEAAVPSYIPFPMDGQPGKIIVDVDSCLQLRITLESGAELAGWLDRGHIDSILNGAYPEEYGCALYNAATGAYLINRTGYPEARYYDTLMAINEDGRASKLMYNREAQTHIPASTPFYIAQTSTDIQPWSIALFIPEGIVDYAEATNRLPDWIGAVLVALLLASIAALGFHLVQFTRKNRACRAAQQLLDDALLNRCAEDARMAYFVYNRRKDRIVRFMNGMQLAEAERVAQPGTVPEMAQIIGLDENDSVRLYDRVRELAAGERAELRMKGSMENEEQLLRLELRCMDGSGDSVIGSIRDWTLETEREDAAKAEERFRCTMSSKASCVWEINATRNRWRLISGRMPYMLQKLGVSRSGWQDYTADLNGPLHAFMDPGDFARYEEVMSISGLSDLMRAGKTETSLDCRVKADEEAAYQWYRLMVRIFRSAENGNLMANLYVSNVDAAKNADLERQERARILQKTLTAIGGIYDGLFYVDLDKDICYTAKSQMGGVSSQLSSGYKDTFDDYISANVHPDDQQEIRQMLSSYQLRKRMTETSHLLRWEYRRRKGDHFEDAAIIIQAARFENGTVRDIVIAMRKYDGFNKVL